MQLVIRRMHCMKTRNDVDTKMESCVERRFAGAVTARVIYPQWMITRDVG